jgi:hypothetical protein
MRTVCSTGGRLPLYTWFHVLTFSFIFLKFPTAVHTAAVPLWRRPRCNATTIEIRSARDVAWPKATREIQDKKLNGVKNNQTMSKNECLQLERSFRAQQLAISSVTKTQQRRHGQLQSLEIMVERVTHNAMRALQQIAHFGLHAKSIKYNDCVRFNIS